MSAPLDVWRVCDQPVTARPRRGCTCHPNDPTPRQVVDALTRLDNHDDKEDPVPPIAPHDPHLDPGPTGDH